jgi:hypothetical protein
LKGAPLKSTVSSICAEARLDNGPSAGAGTAATSLAEPAGACWRDAGSADNASNASATGNILPMRMLPQSGTANADAKSQSSCFAGSRRYPAFSTVFGTVSQTHARNRKPERKPVCIFTEVQDICQIDTLDMEITAGQILQSCPC